VAVLKLLSEGWWTRSQRIRTEGEVPFEVALFFQTEPPTYQKVADKVTHLSQLGMNPNRIAIRLGIDRTTVTRALRWIKSY
jgi:DNA invertase Pin-like site-specific DNA recombinase